MAVDTKGKVFEGNLTCLSTKEMLDQAEIFSEGSKELKDLLVLLWSNGVQTRACCAGHGENRPAFITFYIDKIFDSKFVKLLSMIFSDKCITYIAIDKKLEAFNAKKEENIGELLLTIYLKEFENFNKNILNKFKFVFSNQNIETNLINQDEVFINSVKKLKNTDLSKFNSKDFESKYNCNNPYLNYISIIWKNHNSKFYMRYGWGNSETIVLKGQPEFEHMIENCK